MRETPKIFRCGGIIGCILQLAVFGGCTGLPDYTLPRKGLQDKIEKQWATDPEPAGEK